MSTLQVLGLLWAFPYTLIGFTIGAVGVATGGRCHRQGHTLEFYGGGTTWFVCHLPTRDSIAAITLGHTILGRSRSILDDVRSHERVHVRQYERWGPFFGPAYLVCSLWLWLTGRRAYLDNPFEREAYAKEDPGTPGVISRGRRTDS